MKTLCDIRNIVVLSLLSCSIVLGQTTTGQIFGTVTDASGAAVADAEITVTNVNTGESKTADSGMTGDYIVLSLPAGTYGAVVKKSGFNTLERTGLVLSTVQSLRVDLRLSVGTLTETVTVTAKAPQVDTRSTTLGAVVDDRRITDLPLNGRNAVSLAELVPGVSRVSASSGGPSYGPNSVGINGARRAETNFLMDGGSINTFHRGAGLVLPPPDALQEFKVITTGVTAEYGRGFGVLSAVTRSGTNRFHGHIWDFLRNDALDARTFFSGDVPKLRYNQFGGTFGGPIIRNKTFFFGSYQGLRIRSDRVRSNAFPPTEAERGGDFSATNTQLVDPLNGQPFPGNQIPSSRFDPVAVNVLNTYVKLPNRSDGRYVVQTGQPVTDDQYLARIDHNLTSRNKLSARYYTDYDRGLDAFPQGTNMENYSPLRKFHRAQTMTIEDTHVFSPNVLNTFRATYTRFNYEEAIINQLTLNDLGATDFVHAGGPAKTLPRLVVSGSFNLSPGRYRQRLTHNYDWSENVSWTKDRHQLKWGVDIQQNTFLYRDNRSTGGEFTFDGSQTGSSVADFQIGRARKLLQGSPLETNHRYTVFAAFAQDSFKVHPRLTVNLGLRYELFPHWSESQGKMVALVPGAQSTFIPNAPLGSIYLRDKNFPYKNDRNNFGPRVGMAWDVFGDGRTSVRMGYGISYVPMTAEQAGGVLMPQPFGITHTVNVPEALSAPYLNIENPFPFNFDPNNARFVLPVRMPKSFDPGIRNAYTQNYNFTVQHQLLPNLMVQVGYVGNVGRKLVYLSEGNPAVYGPGATSKNTDARRLFAPTYASIGQLYSGANSSYNGLQVKVNRRFSGGLTFTIAYTYSKAIDEVTTDGNMAVVTHSGMQDPSNRRGDRSLSDYDIRQRWVSSSLYRLPFGKSDTKLSRWLIGGWELGTIFTIQDGRPFSVTSGRDNSLTAVGYDRPNLVGNPFLPTDRPRAELIQEYFDKSAFEANGPGTYGTAGRNILFRPGLVNLDISLTKSFRIREGHQLQFRLDSFNLLNRPNFGAPESRITKSAGKISSASSGRINQVSLKYIF